ncbi:tetratricopeptide repeat protein [Alsobacter sp. KACC 23698]|uniref:Tetratricopeptide repeat protein n=1 Tax=Alsobacter sp. KACC 23698 TaxID=3149229 RepID=A0AAU7JGC3_9HYPH
MPAAPLPVSRRLRPLLLACVGLAALAVTGCKKDGPDSTGSLAASAPRSQDAWRVAADDLGKRYDAKPGDKTVSLSYAHALRMIDQRQQAVAVLQAAALKAPRDSEILSAYGKALIEVGQLQQARDVLAKAHTPERPDWRVLSAQGAVADQLGDHGEAQSLYESALRLRPEDPGVLSNLGLSYALSKRLPEAEAVLRRAAASPAADTRVRQNFALVLGLQGKFAEAEAIARRDLAPVEAAQSVSAMKQMVAQPNSWAQIRKLDGKAGQAGAPAAARTASTDPGAKSAAGGTTAARKVGAPKPGPALDLTAQTAVD